MNNIATLVDLMESFNFASVSSPDTTIVIDAVLKFIKRAETHLGDTLSNHANQADQANQANQANQPTNQPTN